MTAQEFLRRLRKLGLPLVVNASRGKGDHSRLKLGDKVSAWHEGRDTDRDSPRNLPSAGH